LAIELPVQAESNIAGLLRRGRRVGELKCCDWGCRGRPGARVFKPVFLAIFAKVQGALVDADLNVFKVRVGKFKVPLGLERLQFFSNNPSVETASTTGPTSNCEVGASSSRKR
jgi:hypothetical protein